MFESGWILGMHISWWEFLILAFILFVAFFGDYPKPGDGVKDRAIFLQLRYAAGELTTEEYNERKVQLEKDIQVEDSESARN